MTVLYVILLAIVQGITEFLPVSSFGHLSILENFFGMDHNAGVLLEAMLHVGTLGAVFMTFQKDIRHILYEILDMTMDIEIFICISTTKEPASSFIMPESSAIHIVSLSCCFLFP